MNAAKQKSLYNADDYQDCLARIAKLTPDAQPQWGTMTAAQMLSHCAEIQEVSNGKALENTPFIARLFKGMIRKMVVSEKEYPKNTKTHPQYKQRGDKDFEQEKTRLLIALTDFVKEEKESIHSLFGKMTVEERGWGMYKHLHHHLIQFGV